MLVLNKVTTKYIQETEKRKRFAKKGEYDLILVILFIFLFLFSSVLLIQLSKTDKKKTNQNMGTPQKFFFFSRQFFR